MQSNTRLKIHLNEARIKLDLRIELGKKLKDKPSYVSGNDPLVNEYREWDEYNIDLLKFIFTDESFKNEYDRDYFLEGVEENGLQYSPNRTDINRNIANRISRLNSISNRLELYFADFNPSKPDKQIEPNEIQQEVHVQNNQVFVVHGHDEIAKVNLEIFLREIKLEPIVLHRQADEGQTIIEKFEKHSNVGYAFILLTPDEIAYTRSEALN
jgi:hypothetical protein